MLSKHIENVDFFSTELYEKTYKGTYYNFNCYSLVQAISI